MFCDRRPSLAACALATSLVLALAAPRAARAGAQREAPFTAESLAEAVWSWLGERAASAVRGFASLPGEAGWGMDPNGGEGITATDPAPGTADAGWGMDPNG